jgi:hypothetical protein
MPEQQTERAVVQIRPRVLTRDDAAAWLGVSGTTFDKLRKTVPFRGVQGRRLGRLSRNGLRGAAEKAVEGKEREVMRRASRQLDLHTTA